MTLFVFTEEPSIQPIFNSLIPKLNPEARFEIRTHQGKQDLRHAIRTTIPVIAKRPEVKILVAIDQDQEDCTNLKKAIVDDLNNARIEAPYRVVIVCRQLENWFLGDMEAIQSAFPRFNPEAHRRKSHFRSVDLIKNAPHLLKSIIPEFSKTTKLPKLATAEKISRHLTPTNNTSASFLHCVQAMALLLASPSS